MTGHRGPGLRQNRNWRLLWLGQSVSLTGDMVFYVTVLLWIATIIAKGKPWAPAAASGALIATSVPVLIVGPLAGVWVDRWDRRRTMLFADAARALLIASLLVLPALGHRIPVGAQLAVVYSVLAVASSFGEFFDPSRLAILGTIVPPEEQTKASGQLTASFSLAQVIGPPIAAPLLFVFGVEWALLLNAASFAVSFGCVRAIRVSDEAAEAPAPRAGFGEEFRTGLRFFAGNKILMALGIGIVIAMLGNGAVNALAVFFIQRNLHVTASLVGAVIGSVGVGAVTGALLAGRIARRIPPAQMFWLALIIAGVAEVGFARSTALPPAIVAAAIIGLGAGLLNSAFSPLILSVTPSRLLGRVSAVLSPMQQLASIVSMALAGLLASTVLRGFHREIAGVTLGPYDTVLTCSGLLFVIAGLALIAPMRGAGGKPAAAGADPARAAAESAPPAGQVPEASAAAGPEPQIAETGASGLDGPGAATGPAG
jgi:MFS family permease